MAGKIDRLEKPSRLGEGDAGAKQVKRRDFLQASSLFSANLVVGNSLLAIGRAEAATGLPIAALKAELDPRKDLVLVSGRAAPGKFDYDASFSKRKQLTPQVRVIVSSAQAVSSTIRWATGNGVSFYAPVATPMKAFRKVPTSSSMFAA